MQLSTYSLVISSLAVVVFNDTHQHAKSSGLNPCKSQRGKTFALEAQFDKPFQYDTNFGSFRDTLIMAGIPTLEHDTYIQKAIQDLRTRFGIDEFENVDIQELKTKNEVSKGRFTVGIFNELNGNFFKAEYQTRGKVFCPELPVVSAFIFITLTEEDTFGNMTVPVVSFVNYGLQTFMYRGERQVIHATSRMWTLFDVPITATESYFTIIYNLWSETFGRGISTTVTMFQNGREGRFARGTYSFTNNLDV